MKFNLHEKYRKTHRGAFIKRMISRELHRFVCRHFSNIYCCFAKRRDSVGTSGVLSPNDALDHQGCARPSTESKFASATVVRKLPRSHRCMHRRSLIVFRPCAKVVRKLLMEKNVNYNNGATLSKRQYFAKTYCYLRGWEWMFSNE